MKIEVSNGEIIDKFTILEIKLDRIDDPAKLLNIQKEYDILFPIVENILELKHPLVNELKTINERLWDIEDNIRVLEKSRNFGPSFIDLARQVYISNDVRARIKKEINILTNSGLTEEKSYKEY